MRVLVTGSRSWLDRETIRSAMLAQWDKAGRGDVTLVHGAAEGADVLAASVALELHWTIEPHPALWRDFGKSAGPIRNAEMVGMGADVCLAFPLFNSRGTIDCMMRAHHAGIPVLVYAPSDIHGTPWEP